MKRLFFYTIVTGLGMALLFGLVARSVASGGISYDGVACSDTGNLSLTITVDSDSCRGEDWKLTVTGGALGTQTANGLLNSEGDTIINFTRSGDIAADDVFDVELGGGMIQCDALSPFTYSFTASACETQPVLSGPPPASSYKWSDNPQVMLAGLANLGDETSIKDPALSGGFLFVSSMGENVLEYGYWTPDNGYVTLGWSWLDEVGEKVYGAALGAPVTNAQLSEIDKVHVPHLDDNWSTWPPILY